MGRELAYLSSHATNRYFIPNWGKTIDTETLLLKVESHEHRIGIMENLLRDAKQVLTLEEAALFMGISKSSLYKMTHKHELPFFRPNGKIIYFEKSELLNWMRQNRSMSEAETKAAATKHMSELCK
nr:helix-turn-helix domain-containing protein [uncultured Prevotella sp.]